ncbi:DUF932 domain-containing protein [Peterkaempfera sp. SMS 1(5)a]|uniref:DUF932 domain-containing protein n=1 Tax=Peterkaempfera podocarpi TaxID=3232308 RepID=UPI00367253A7
MARQGRWRATRIFRTSTSRRLVDPSPAPPRRSPRGAHGVDFWTEPVEPPETKANRRAANREPGASNRARNNAAKRTEQLRAVRETETGRVGHTAYAAERAVTGYLDHHKTLRPGGAFDSGHQDFPTYGHLA